jgi:hypothetical protein
MSAPQFVPTTPSATLPAGASPPTLDYAAPMLESERHPQAEAILLAGGPTEEYLRLFKSTGEAARFFERFQTARFAARNVDGVCAECGRATEDVAVAVWRSYFPLRTLEFSVDSAGHMVNLAMFHSLCHPCVTASRRRRRLHRRGIAIAVALALPGFVCLIWSAYSPPWAVALKERVGYYFYVPPMLLIVAAAVMVHLRERMAERQLPRGLRGLGLGTMTEIHCVESRIAMPFQL